MTLTKRQYWILRALYKNEGEYIKSSYFANSMNCTMRSIQMDLKHLKEEAENRFFHYDSRKNLGTRLVITDMNGFISYLNRNAVEESGGSGSREERISVMFYQLVQRKKPVTVQKLSEITYTSASTVRNDLKYLDRKLKQYEIETVRKSGSVLLKGKERDRRFAIIDLCLNIMKKRSSHPEIWQSGPILENDLRKIFRNYQYSVSDHQLKQAVLWLQISMERIGSGFVLPETTDDQNIEKRTLQIAGEAAAQIRKKWQISMPESEISYFAFYIESSAGSETRDISTSIKEMPSFITEAFEQLDTMFGTTFCQDHILCQQLIYHCNALAERIIGHIEYSNDLRDFVVNNYPAAMDIAICFACLFDQKFHLSASQDEITYIALYFQQSLERQEIHRKNVVIITSLRSSECILLKELLKTEFASLIADVTFLPSTISVQEILTSVKYDCLLSTEDHPSVENGMAEKITYPPSQSELQRIRSVIAGYGVQDVLNLFSENLYFTADIDNRHTAVNYLISQTENCIHDYSLADVIDQREKYYTNYYENGVAILKPVRPLPLKSFASILLLEKGVHWEKGRSVSLVIFLNLQEAKRKPHLAWNGFAPTLFAAGWRQQLNGDMSYGQLMHLIRTRLNRSIFEKGMPNLKV